MIKISKRYDEALELIVKISYLCLTLATFISYLYISELQPALVKGTLILGGILILVRIFRWRRYIKMPCFILMILFCFSFLLTTVMNMKYGVIENGKWIIWTGIQFFALYVCDLERDAEKYKKEFTLISHIIIVSSGFAALASLVMLVQGSTAFLTSGDGEFIVTGFTWGRLWGVYTDPNYGAVFSVIGIVLSVLFLIKKKGVVRSLYVLNAVLNYLYLTFSDSRTGEIALFVSGGVFFFIYLTRKWKEKKCAVRYGAAVLIICCSAAAVMGSMQGLKTVNNKYQASISEPVTPQEPQPVNPDAGRKQDIQEDVSNGRFSLWESAVEVWETSPLYGAGYSTFVPYAKENVPDTYAVNNGQGDYTSMHNAFLNALAFQGSLGFILFALITVRILTYVLKPVFSEVGNDYLDLAAMLSCTGAVAVGMMFLLDGIYTNSPTSFVLWTFCGYMAQHTYRRNKGERK